MTNDEKALDRAVQAAQHSDLSGGFTCDVIRRAIEAYKSAKQPAQAEALQAIREKLQSIHWHGAEGTVNSSIFTNLANECLGLLTALEASAGNAGGGDA
jgi:CO dehydrogenase/acetyl-CoA synthase epsilon subunit